MSAAVEVFAVEATSLQLSWSRLPARQVVFEVAGRSFDVDAAFPRWYRRKGGRKLDQRLGGPGALTVDGLEPGTAYDVLLSGPGVPARRVATATTLQPPPGRVLSRFATVNDCHIGERVFGPTGKLRDPVPRPDGFDPYPVRALRAAIEESVAWGAEAIVAKGDITQGSKPSEAKAAANLLGSSAVPVPVHGVLGNHDIRRPGADVAAALSRVGVNISRDAQAVDLPGVRIVLGFSPIMANHSGRITPKHLDDLVDLVGEAPGPVVLALHHPPGLNRLPRYSPPPIVWSDTQRLVERVARANPATLLIGGHTHRNRFYRVGPLAAVEVGSTKDYPGQWAGYTVYESGIVQVVKRVAAPDVIPWTEMTGRALGGLWGWWSPGTLADRCWSYDWPVRPSGS